jgi:hypothetical protein
VDLDGDGNLDILSGSYSRQDKDMAGLLQVLRGQKGGTFKKAAALLGSDGEPLILPAGTGDDTIIDKICTRAFAADLDSDGKLDLVVGNFRGTFGLFAGEGGGKFAPRATWLQADGNPMKVDSHGDPFLVDWDGDGDLDLLSGSAQGGVFLFTNQGTKKQPRFAAKAVLAAPAGHHGVDAKEAVRFGDAHLKAPGGDTRVWAADVDGDGLLDLLVGDRVTLIHKQKDVSEDTARIKLAAWSKKQQEFFSKPRGEDEASQQKWQETYAELRTEKEKFAVDEMTGFVWLLRQKAAVR